MTSFFRSRSRSRNDRSSHPRRAGAPVETFEPRVLFATLAISDAVVVEGNTGTTDAVFTVSLYQPGSDTVTVNYTTNNSTATTPADYQTTSGTLTFAPGGPTTQTITVHVVGDTDQEANEQFRVDLSAPVNATIVSGGTSGTGYIVDDDEALLSIQSVAVTEGSTGTTPAVFTVTRSGSTAGTTTVQYTTNPSTATSPADFAVTSGTLTFAPGETAKTITVQVAGDTAQESTEAFSVSLSGAVNGTLVNTAATGTIIDDDDNSVSVQSVVAPEGDTGTSQMVFTVTRRGSLGGPATVNYRTSDSSAHAGEDYTQTTGTLVFAAGEASKQVSVPVLGDAAEENNEQFNFILENANNTTIADSTVQGLIIDNDASVFAIESAITNEGDAGTTPLTFNVRRFGSLAGSSTLNYTTSNSSATTPGDYALTNGTVTFAPGESIKTITVLVNGDTEQEFDEQFNVSISNPTNGTVSQATAQGVIVDDDESVISIVGGGAVNEGNSGTTPLTFTVLRIGSVDGTSTVNYATSASSATTPSDFANKSGTLTFGPGESSKTVTVDVNGDTDAEQNEVFRVSLSAIDNASYGQSSAEGWIVNDDGAVTTSYYFISDVAVAEGDAGTTPATFTVRRLGLTTLPGSVNYAATPNAGQDFAPASGTLAFAPGETEKTFNVDVTGDATDEDLEQYSAFLSSPVGGQIGDGSGAFAIVDDDKVVVYVSDASTEEGDDAGGHDVTFTVRRFGDTGGQSTVNYATRNSSATAPQDYQPKSGTVTFAPGDASEEFTVRVVGDTAQEADELFLVDLSSPVNATVIGGAGQGFIADDDQSYLAASDASVVEGTGGTGPTLNFVVTRFGSADGTVSVNYNTRASSALADSDFAPATGTLTFGPGETIKTVSVSVVPDSRQESNEQMFLDLSQQTNTTLARSSGTGRIADDDDSWVTLSGAAVVEGDAGTRNAVFTLTRHGSTAGTSSVEFRTSNSSAQAPGDYAQVVQTVTFAPGETSKTVNVAVNGDTTQENTEQFGASLASADNTTIAGPSVLGYILDDDESFLYIDNIVATEGNPATPTSAVFTVRRFGSLDGASTVNFQTQASTATTPGDFAATSGTVAFAAGESSKTITVPIAADFIREAEKTFYVNLNAADNATIVDSQGRATLLDDDPVPAVAQVYVAGTSWANSFKTYMAAQGQGSAQYGYAVPGGANQLDELPWTNLNQVSVTFTSDVIVESGDLQVRGVNVLGYPISNFNYDPNTRTATWTLGSVIANDKVLLDLDADSPNGVKNGGGEFLDGEWGNGFDTYPSGNGFGGGDFRFQLNVLPGDANRDGRVNAVDLSNVRGRQLTSTSNAGTAPNTYNVFSDVNGTGNINAVDLSGVRANQLKTLPGPNPTAATSLLRDGLFGDRLIK